MRSEYNVGRCMSVREIVFFHSRDYINVLFAKRLSDMSAYMLCFVIKWNLFLITILLSLLLLQEANITRN